MLNPSEKKIIEDQAKDEVRFNRALVEKFLNEISFAIPCSDGAKFIRMIDALLFGLALDLRDEALPRMMKHLEDQDIPDGAMQDYIGTMDMVLMVTTFLAASLGKYDMASHLAATTMISMPDILDSINTMASVIKKNSPEGDEKGTRVFSSYSKN